MRVQCIPNPSAAFTNGRWRISTVRSWEIRAKPIQPSRERTTISVHWVGPSADNTMTATSSPGNATAASATRMSAASVQPRWKPAMMPIADPKKPLISDHCDAGRNADLAAVDQPGEHVPTQLVRTQRMAPVAIL